MRAIEFIFESYPLAKKEFSQVANPTEVQATIDQYRELVRKNQFRNPAEKNINYWRERGWEAFSQMVKVKSNDVTDTQLKKGKVVGNAIILQDDAEWVVLIPLDKDTSVHYGRGTEWCTTKSYWAYFEDYVYNRNITLIYAIDKTKAGRSVAISIEPDTEEGEKIDMFNQNDDPIDAIRYKRISGLDSEYFINTAKMPENQQQLAASIEKYKVARESTRLLLRANPFDPEAIERELKFTKNADDCYEYIIAYSQEHPGRVRVHPSIVAAVSNHVTSKTENNVGRYIDFTSIPIGVLRSISRTTPEFILYNASELTPNQQIVITEYETTIKDNPEKSYKYASEVLHGPFLAGEAAIATSAEHSLHYAFVVLEKPFPAGEAAIATDAEYSYKYASMVLEGKRFPAGEAAIATDAGYSYYYAHYVIKKEFPAGEAAIATNAGYSFNYALYAIEKRFLAGEAAIATNADLIVKYNKRFGVNILSDYAKSIIDDPKKSFYYAYKYKTPFPEGEDAIATSAPYSYMYATDVLNRPFPAGEAAIATSPEHASQYDKKFGTNLAQQ